MTPPSSPPSDPRGRSTQNTGGADSRSTCTAHSYAHTGATRNDQTPPWPIINLASGVGLNPVPYGSAYVTSKAAVIRLSEALAIEAEEYGVTVFAIDPGWVSTAMTDYVTQSDQGKRWMPWTQSVIGTDAHVPPERAAELVATLASGRADRLTGRYLRVSDDLEDLIHRAEHIRDHDLHSMRLRDER